MDKGLPIDELPGAAADRDPLEIVEVAADTGGRGVADEVADLVGDVDDPMTESDDAAV